MQNGHRKMIIQFIFAPSFSFSLTDVSAHARQKKTVSKMDLLTVLE